MAFMVPYYTDEAFVIGTNENGEDIAVPADVADLFDFVGDTTTIEGKWFCRLSAPGYMDCTDWSGPYDTEGEAREAISDLYDVDPDTGDELTDHSL